MDEFFYAGTDEGDAEQVPAVLVDDHAGAAGAAVGVQSGPGHRLAGPSLAQVAQAKAICAGCPVRRECLAFALRTHQVHGVWGGLSEQERHPLRSVTPARVECGQAAEVGTVHAADQRDDHKHAGAVAAADYSPRSA
jgi:Transcription factor WhiB